MNLFREYFVAMAIVCAAFVGSFASELQTDLPLPPAGHLNPGIGPKAPILVPLRLRGGEELLFMVDTGSRFTILDRSLEPSLGKRLGTKAMHYNWYPGKLPWGIYASPELSLNGVPLRMGKRVFTDDLTRIWPGRPMMGILGMDCLWHYCVQLDLFSGEIRFLDAERLEPAGLGRAFPLGRYWGAVFTRMDFFERQEERFFLDTADYLDGALRSKLFRLALEKQSAVWIRQGKGPAGTLNRIAYPEQCLLAQQAYTNLVFKDSSVGAHSSLNTLGLRFLGRHLITLNFPKKVMYLKRMTCGSREDASPPVQPNHTRHQPARVGPQVCFPQLQARRDCAGPSVDTEHDDL